ncbi:SH3 domain-containing protein [Luteimonas aquatica]|uniref:SH3 domain-containing protein n=1 Tax=Luteimonas aquatica TaxID=450364 RepID=UPI001F56B8AA|nr:SH3 domain-containing protein [Luteimonas aquatica]
MKRARVVLPHRAPDRPAIRVGAGDTVTLGERDSDWPQFVWTSLTSGLGGWVPAMLFDREQGLATARQDYDTRELDADPGELLVLHDELADWWWAENAQGTRGWIPARVLELID